MTETFADLISNRFNSKTDTGKDRTAEGTPALILKHRSRRAFKDTPVSGETLELLYACAMSSPQKSDLQQVAIIHLRDRAGMEAVADLIPSMPWIKQAPVFLLFCGDGRRIQRTCELRGTPFSHDPLDAFMNAAVDAALTMQNFITAAEAEGLGCCPVSAVREVADTVVRVAGLPDRVFPVAGLAVGYPTDDPAISIRLPLRTTVHVDRYDDKNLAADLDDYDRIRHEKNPIASYKQRDKDRFGTREFYGWSDDKARQTAMTERGQFCTLIRRTFGPLD